MVNSLEADFNPRETTPLPHNILCRLAWEPANPWFGKVPKGQANYARAGQGQVDEPDGAVTDETNSAYSSVSTEAGHAHIPAKKVATGKSDLPCRRSGTAESGMGWYDNRHLNYLVKTILMNTGDCPRNGDDNPSVKQGQSRCRHSSPRMGEPATRRRATVCWKVLGKRNRVQTWRNCIHEYR